jgi:hypothetical protein
MWVRSKKILLKGAGERKRISLTELTELTEFLVCKTRIISAIAWGRIIPVGPL